MTHPDPSSPWWATQPLDRVRAAGARDTLDLPAVPPLAEPPLAEPPLAEPPGAAPRTGPPGRPARRRRSVVVAGVLLGAAVAGVGTGAVLGLREATPGATAGAADDAAAVLPASVASVDPAGGSGFRQDGDAWDTQTYRTAEFGNLKSGVGLLLDLGTATEVTSVTLDAATEGLAVELRASDEPAAAVEGAVADAVEKAGGSVTLSGQGAGAHRYWLVWVTRLAPADGGFAARIGTPVVHGPGGATG
jgi:hypothetical protein